MVSGVIDSLSTVDCMSQASVCHSTTMPHSTVNTLYYRKGSELTMFTRRSKEEGHKQYLVHDTVGIE